MPNALSRKKDYRHNLLRNLATSLVLYEEIKTTQAKAKALKPVVERLIVLAKRNNLVARRRLDSFFFDKNATKKILEVLGPRYKKINSGFIKTFRMAPRVGDNAQMILMQLVGGQEEIKEAPQAIVPKEEIKKEKDASKTTKPANDSKELAPSKLKGSKTASKTKSRK